MEKSINQYLLEIDYEKDVLLDVRTKLEYKSGSIPHSINFPLDKIGKYNGDKTKAHYVYCRSGHRSRLAVEKLIKMGYNAINIGGILSYKK